MALHCLLSVLHYSVVCLYLFIIKMKNRHGHWVCWMPTGRHNCLMCTTHITHFSNCGHVLETNLELHLEKNLAERLHFLCQRARRRAIEMHTAGNSQKQTHDMARTPSLAVYDVVVTYAARGCFAQQPPSHPTPTIDYIRYLSRALDLLGLQSLYGDKTLKF